MMSKFVLFMVSRLILMIAVFVLPAFGQDWSPQLAARYLDARQKEWFAWPRAARPDGPCVSCHTGMTYLLVRPDLRRALSENQPTPYEQGLLDGLRTKTRKKNPEELAKAPSPALGVETIFSTLFLSLEDTRSARWSAETTQAFDQLWTLQIREGKTKGAWPWNITQSLDPWEMPESSFFGATLAALAIGTAPAEYRNRQEIRERVGALLEYLEREQQTQPLHNRLMQLWASANLPGLLSEPMRQSLIAEILQRQQADGGWTIESLGPWRPHPEAPSSTGSSSYATGFVAFTLQKAGVPRTHPAVHRALDWLRSRQDRQFGHWPADSMNKRHEADSMQVRFMQDAATAFATLALLEAR